MAEKQNRWYARKDVAWGVLAAVLGIYLWLALRSEGTAGGADSYVHYQMARYAFKYPHLFFDPWGKPVFTLLSAPFAQFGFDGMRVFNLLCGMGSAWLAFLLARRLSLPYPLLALVVVLTVPLYAVILMSGLTEPLFGLVLIASLYLFFSDRPLASAVVLSFIPFCRTEGVIFWPLLITALLLTRNYKALPGLLVGPVLMSFAGAWAHEGDLFWVVTRLPYVDAGAVYGSGSFWYFFRKADLVFGLPLLILAISGMGVLLVRWMQEPQDRTRQLTLLLLVGTVLGYFLAHSVVWWLGRGASAGLTRVLVGVIPVAGVIALHALVPLGRLSATWWRPAVAAVFGIWAVVQPFTTNKFPVQPMGEERVLKQATTYVQSYEGEERYLVYYNPTAAIFLNLDPWDFSRSRERVADAQFPSQNLPEGSLVLWDSHFGPNEGGLSWETLQQDPALQVLQEFHPETPFETLGGHAYRVVVFEVKRTPSVL